MLSNRIMGMFSRAKPRLSSIPGSSRFSLLSHAYMKPLRPSAPYAGSLTLPARFYHNAKHSSTPSKAYNLFFHRDHWGTVTKPARVRHPPPPPLSESASDVATSPRQRRINAIVLAVTSLALGFYLLRSDPPPYQDIGICARSMSESLAHPIDKLRTRSSWGPDGKIQLHAHEDILGNEIELFPDIKTLQAAANRTISASDTSFLPFSIKNVLFHVKDAFSTSFTPRYNPNLLSRTVKFMDDTHMGTTDVANPPLTTGIHAYTPQTNAIPQAQLGRQTLDSRGILSPMMLPTDHDVQTLSDVDIAVALSTFYLKLVKCTQARDWIGVAPFTNASSTGSPTVQHRMPLDVNSIDFTPIGLSLDPESVAYMYYKFKHASQSNTPYYSRTAGQVYPGAQLSLELLNVVNALQDEIRVYYNEFLRRYPIYSHYYYTRLRDGYRAEDAINLGIGIDKAPAHLPSAFKRTFNNNHIMEEIKKLHETRERMYSDPAYDITTKNQHENIFYMQLAAYPSLPPPDMFFLNWCEAMSPSPEVLQELQPSGQRSNVVQNVYNIQQISLLIGGGLAESLTRNDWLSKAAAMQAKHPQLGALGKGASNPQGFALPLSLDTVLPPDFNVGSIAVPSEAKTTETTLGVSLHSNPLYAPPQPVQGFGEWIWNGFGSKEQEPLVKPFSVGLFLSQRIQNEDESTPPQQQAGTPPSLDNAATTQASRDDSPSPLPQLETAINQYFDSLVMHAPGVSSPTLFPRRSNETTAPSTKGNSSSNRRSDADPNRMTTQLYIVRDKQHRFIDIISLDDAFYQRIEKIQPKLNGLVAMDKKITSFYFDDAL